MQRLFLWCLRLFLCAVALGTAAAVAVVVPSLVDPAAIPQPGEAYTFSVQFGATTGVSCVTASVNGRSVTHCRHTHPTLTTTDS